MHQDNGMVLLIIVGVSGLFILLYIIYLYNSLIARKNNIDYALGTIDTLLKKRFDLIPNLVETTKAYMKHEREVLEKVVELRKMYADTDFKNTSTSEIDKINDEITKGLKSIFAIVENYPTLKANENMLHLQKTLTEIEEQISAARRAYNAAVMEYNNMIEQFPSNIIAEHLNYKRRDYFNIPEEEKRNIQLKDMLQQK